MKNKIVGGLVFILGLLLMLFLPIVGHAEGIPMMLSWRRN